MIHNYAALLTSETKLQSKIRKKTCITALAKASAQKINCILNTNITITSQEQCINTMANNKASLT